MGNTIISSLLFQPPTPANELDYFGSVNVTAAAVTSPSSSNRSAHNDSSNQAVHKSKGHFVRGGGSHNHHSSSSSRQQPSQQQQVVTINSNEPTLHYIWLVSPTHPIPIPALHIQHSTSLRPSNTPSTNRYTLLYSHGNAEDIGLLAKFLTDISKLLQVDILVYDYTGYGVSVDRRAVLRFYAVWGGRLEEWRRWRRSQSRSRNGGASGNAEMRQDEGKNNGVRYSMDVFMAPMVFAKTTAETAASNAASSGKETSSASPSSSSALNLPDNVYVCGDELDFIEDDATTIATASDNDHQYHQRTTSSSGRSRRSSSATTTSEPRDNSLLDIDDDYDNDDYDDYDDDMPSVTATCYENSTMHGDDDDDTEDEVSLFTCGASCNEVEHSSIVGGLEEEEYEEDDMMRDDPTSEFSASSSYHHHHHHSSQSSSPRSISGGSTTTATVMSSSSQRRNSSQRRGRRGHPNRQISIRAPLTPKQKRRALLRKHKWTMPSPSEEQCYGDIQLAYNYLLQIQEVPAKHVLLYGKSVGSGPTCWLAQRTCQSSSVGSSSSKDVAYDASGVGGGGGMMYEDVRDDGDVDYRDERVGGGAANVSVGGSGAGGSNNKSSLVGRSCDDDDAPGGVILHSPFLSVIRVVLDMGFTTVGDLFPNIDRVKDFTCPTYIIHGTQDEIVPYYHGQGLFNGLSDTSKAVPFWANGAGHNNIEMEMPTAYIKRLMQFVRQCDRLNYPAGELLRTRAFSSGSHGSGPKITTSSKQQRGGSAHSQQELDSALHLPNNLHRKHTHTRQMMSSVSKQRKKKGHSNSPTMVVNTMNTTTPKRRQGGGGRSHRNSNNSISMEQQQVMMQHHHGKYHHHQAQQQYQQHHQQHHQHQSARRDQYPSVVTNLSTDAAMCGIHEPSVESKYYTQYLQQQQQQQQQSSYY